MAANHRDQGPDEPQIGRFQIDPSKPVEVVIHNRRGGITVRGVNRQDVLLRADIDHADDLEAVLNIVQDDNRIEIRTDAHGRHAGRRATRDARRAARDIFRRRESQFSKGGVTGSWQIDFDEHLSNELRDLLPFRGGGGSHDLEIEVPVSGVEVRVEAHTASGDVNVADVHGAVDVATATGEIALSRISGDITVQTASGEIDVTEATGSLRARSASGDLTVRDGSLEQYVVNTASGDVNIVTTLIGSGPYRIDAVSGDIDLILDAPDHVLARGFTIPFQTVSGEGRMSGGIHKINRRTWRYGPDSDNALELAIRTVSGDANVSLARKETSTVSASRSAAPDDATIPLPPRPPDPPRPPKPPTIVTDTMPRASSTPHDHETEGEEALLIAQDAVFEAQDAAFRAQDAALEAQDAALAAQDAAIEAQDETGAGAAVTAAEEASRHADALTRIADEMASTLNHVSSPTAASQAVPDDRLSILAALEQGEIDIDEAMRKLDELAPNP